MYGMFRLRPSFTLCLSLTALFIALCPALTLLPSYDGSPGGDYGISYLISTGNHNAYLNQEPPLDQQARLFKRLKNRRGCAIHRCTAGGQYIPNSYDAGTQFSMPIHNPLNIEQLKRRAPDLPVIHLQA